MDKQQRFAVGDSLSAVELNTIIAAKKLGFESAQDWKRGTMLFIISDAYFRYYISQPFMSNTITVTRVEEKGG